MVSWIILSDDFVAQKFVLILYLMIICLMLFGLHFFGFCVNLVQVTASRKNLIFINFMKWNHFIIYFYFLIIQVADR